MVKPDRLTMGERLALATLSWAIVAAWQTIVFIFIIIIWYAVSLCMRPHKPLFWAEFIPSNPVICSPPRTVTGQLSSVDIHCFLLIQLHSHILFILYIAMHFRKILGFLWLYVHMTVIDLYLSIYLKRETKDIYIFKGWTYVLTLISRNNYWPSIQSYSLFFIVHYRQLLLAYFFPPHLHPHSDTLRFLISFWEVTGSGCRWAPGSSPGWRKHQSTGTAVPSHHYFSPYKNISSCCDWPLPPTGYRKPFKMQEDSSWQNIQTMWKWELFCYNFTGFMNCSHSLWGIPGYGPDRRRRTSWTLYLDLFFSILVTNAYHSVHHSQGQVLTVICPPLIEICIRKWWQRSI